MPACARSMRWAPRVATASARTDPVPTLHSDVMHSHSLRRLSAWLALSTLALALHPCWAALRHVAGVPLPPSLQALCSPLGTPPDAMQLALASSGPGEPEPAATDHDHSICPLCRAASWFPADLLRRDLAFPAPVLRTVWPPTAEPPSTRTALIRLTAPARAPPSSGL